MKKTDAAYVAGLLDGEGYIGLTKSRGSFRPRIIIANCNLSLLEYVQRIIGGYICAKSKHATWTQGYNLTVLHFDDWLPEILPFMVSKKPKALLIIEAKKILAQRQFLKNRTNGFGMDRLIEINELLRKKEWEL